MDNSKFNSALEVMKLFEWQRIAFLIVGIMILVYLSRFLGRFSKKLYENFPSKRLLILQVVTIVTFALYIFGTTSLVYAALRPPKELLIALGGSAAVAIGFALKDIVASIVAGLILLFDRPFQVGDRVSFGDVYGEIQSIGLRAVRLVTLDDNLVTIPNSKFITDYVASGNAGALDMMICVPFHTTLDVDIERVNDILREVVVTSLFAYLEKPIKIVLEEKEMAHQLGLKFLVKAYVIDVRFEKALQSDIVKRGTIALRDAKINRPVSIFQKVEA